MAVTLLKNKLFIPPAHAALVPRPRLIQRMDQAWSSKLTLVSAPAGFGKTTLLSEWALASRQPVAWLSLDAGDNTPARFLSYLIAALQRVREGLGESLRSMLDTTQFGSAKMPPDTIFQDLINEIADLAQSFAVILDDYHTISEPSIHHVLGFFLDNQPGCMHLVISGRADPPWPLGRLRVQRAVNEVRASDLRFTPAEAAAFLNEIMKLDLSAEIVNELEKRTEGWIAGLQMAALSVQAMSDRKAFLAGFTGSHRFISDFLVEEVLAHQPPETSEFLLKTSILERLTAPLCDAVAGITNSDEMLSRLELANLFLIPLDNERCWYRYHHLFKDLLYGTLKSSRPDEVPALHRTASRWYAQAGYNEDAVLHAFAARDYELAAVLVEQAVRHLEQNKLMAISRWIDDLPQEQVERRPWLCVYRAWGRYWTGRREQVEACLQAAEKALDNEEGPAGSQDLSEEERSHIIGSIAAVRAHYALTSEDIQGVLKQSKIALALLPEGDDMRCETAVALGGAYWALGDVHKSEEAFAMARANALQWDFPTMAVPSTCYVAMQQTKQGRIPEAMAAYREALAMATGADGRELPGASFPNVKLGDLLRETNNLDAAGRHLEKGVEQCVVMGQADVLADGYVALARLQLTRADLAGAHESLANADRIAAQTKIDPFVQCWLDDVRLRVWLAEGNLEAALEWVQASGLRVDGELSYHYDLHHINLARALVAEARLRASPTALNDALKLLERLLPAAEQADWTQEVIKILVLRALARQTAGDEEAALEDLARALALAEPGGYVRLFLDEGAPLLGLLSKLAGRGIMAAYVAQLLDEARRDAPAARKPLRPAPGQVEPLSAREIQVLRLLASAMTSTEIAAELCLAVSTVRTHIKNIYAKLDVNRRLEAVQRGRELGLL
jgi:LuxR family maltose regulon positive regulatory protein